MCFWKAFHLILMHVIHKIQFFEEFLYYFALFFKKLIFSEFRPIKIVFRLTEIAIKNVCESLSVSIDARLVSDQSKHFWLIESVFQTIKNRVENFFKNWFSRVQIHFFKSCSTFCLSLSLSLSLSLYHSVKAPIQIFVIFLHSFYKVFLSQGQ